MDLSTTYMGFQLPHPLIPGASPLVDSLDTVRALEDAGAPMIVMRSLFEEQIVQEEVVTNRSIETPKESFAEALSYFPEPDEFTLGPYEYLERLRRIKGCVSVPVVGSLNGTTEGGWLEYARLIEQAGADALELNVYELATDFAQTGEQVECRALRVIRAVRASVSIPVAVKLSPFYSSLAHFARAVDELGVSALVLFNRFYQPDIDVEQLEAVPRVQLSTSAELLLRLRWLAILSGRVSASLAATGGALTVVDTVKAVMAGAHGVQLVSALLHHGPGHLAELRTQLAQWLEEHEYGSLRQLQGSMSLLRCDNPAAFERAHYMRALQGYRPEAGRSGAGGLQ
jgi:dihydroorotate dehydrogenase (fumarate)